MEFSVFFFEFSKKIQGLEFKAGHNNFQPLTYVLKRAEPSRAVLEKPPRVIHWSLS
jgi:hypothetical protein